MPYIRRNRTVIAWMAIFAFCVAVGLWHLSAGGNPVVEAGIGPADVVTLDLKTALALEVGDPAQVDGGLRSVMDTTLESMDARRDSVEQLELVELYSRAARGLSLAEGRAADAALEDYVATTAPCMSTWAARAVLASNALDADDTDTALRHYQGLIDDVSQEYLEGVLAAREGSDENKARLLHTLGNAFLQTGRAEEALLICERQFEEYGRIEPMTEQSKYVRAVALRVLNPDDLPQALDAFDDFLEDYPESESATLAIYDVGNLQIRLKDYDGAIWNFEQVAADPNSASLEEHALVQLGMACNLAGRYEEAVAAYEQVLAKAPENERALGGLMLAMEKRDTFDEHGKVDDWWPETDVEADTRRDNN